MNRAKLMIRWINKGEHCGINKGEHCGIIIAIYFSFRFDSFIQLLLGMGVNPPPPILDIKWGITSIPIHHVNDGILNRCVYVRTYVCIYIYICIYVCVCVCACVCATLWARVYTFGLMFVWFVLVHVRVSVVPLYVYKSYTYTCISTVCMYILIGACRYMFVCVQRVCMCACVRASVYLSVCLSVCLRFCVCFSASRYKRSTKINTPRIPAYRIYLKPPVTKLCVLIHIVNLILFDFLASSPQGEFSFPCRCCPW